MTPTPQKTLDLRTTKCPLNFVQTKLALEKLALGDILEVWILPGAESALNIPKSIVQEGHRIVETCRTLDEPPVEKLYIEKMH
jgi:TusA-related sulfurtransferase